MIWLEIAIRTTSLQSELVADILFDIGVQGGAAIYDPQDLQLFDNDPKAWDYVDPTLFEAMEQSGVIVKGYIPNDERVEERLSYVKQRISQLLEHCAEEDFIELLPQKLVDDLDWIEVWKKHFTTKKIGRRLVIKPSWEKYEPIAEELIVQIDPGMAFGTGTHETTIMCMRELEKVIMGGETILDIGCGTAILSIAAVLLGAKAAIAVDIDADSVRVAEQYVHDNDVKDAVTCYMSDLFESIPNDIRADIVIANIIADVVIAASAQVKQYLKKNGLFISSGIILDRINDVERALEENHLEHLYTVTMGEWAAVVAKNA